VLQDLFGVGNESTVLSIQEVMTGTAKSFMNGLLLKTQLNTSTNPTSLIGIENTVSTTSGSATAPILGAGMLNNFLHKGSGTISTAYGSPGVVSNKSNGTITSAYGVYGNVTNDSTGTVGSAAAGYFAANTNGGGGTLTTNYGIYLEAQTAGTTRYNIYSSGLASRNYFAGFIETDAAGGFYLGTTGSVNNRFLLNAPLSVDAAAEQMNRPSSTARKALVLQMNSGQTANAFEIQDNSGTLLTGFSSSGDIISNTSSGIKIGTATTQKLGFFNVTPVVQQGSDASSLVTFGFNSSLSAVTFTKEVAATINPADTVTAATAGAALTVKGGAGSPTTSGVGGALNLTGGAAQAGNSNGGAINLTGGAGAGVSTGGALNLAGGNGTVGGAVLLDGGTGVTAGNVKLGTVRGLVTIGNGSAAAPKLVFENSTTTGLYRKGADNLGLSIAGTLNVDWAATVTTWADAVNLAFGTSTGTKIGTATTQKLGFWNATPVVQNTGWTVTGGYTTDKAFNPESTTLTEVARVLGTLVDQLKTYGILGG
jgi:hypothetical protein